MKKLIIKMVKFNAPDGKCPTCATKFREGQEIDSSYMARIKDALDQAPQGGFPRSEDKIRNEIEDKLIAAADANKGKLPFDLILEDTLAEHLKRIAVEDFRPSRRGSDLRQMFKDIENMIEVEIENDVVVETNKKSKGKK